MSPQRFQRKRTKGWKMPEGSAYVGRGSRWGNPIRVFEYGESYPSLDLGSVAVMVVRDFRVLAQRGELSFPNYRFLDGSRGHVRWVYPPLSEVRSELAGKDLMCWCPEDQACHADVLLELANAIPEAERAGLERLLRDVEAAS